jgi:hypothetical protein
MEGQLTKEVTQQCKKFNRRMPEVIIVLHEESTGVNVASNKGQSQGKAGNAAMTQHLGSSQKSKSRQGPDVGKEKTPETKRKGPASPLVEKLPAGLVANRRAANPRENPSPDMDPEDLTYG